MYDVAMPAGMLLDGNVTMLLPSGQIAVAAIGTDVPTLLSQLALASANLQSSLVAGAVHNSHSVVSPNVPGSSLGNPNTVAQSDNSAFTQQNLEHDESPSNVSGLQ